ncbi:MAG: hypothetical protein P1S46_01675 [bacterium]|nr:hypothetical protein [bacterium]MDT8366910.1 hypothetical protein [bacterium]
MKRVPFFLLALIIATGMTITPDASAEGFSLFGVKMGMVQEAVNAAWQQLETGDYYIEGSALINLVPEFDHRNRLYRLSFSTPIPLLDQHPGTYVTTAFQESIQELWASDDLAVSLRTGRGSADISLTSKSLQKEYADHVRAQMKARITDIFRP